MRESTPPRRDLSGAAAALVAALACGGCNLLVSLDEKTSAGTGGSGASGASSASSASTTPETASASEATSASNSASSTTTSSGPGACPAEPPRPLRPLNGAFTGSVLAAPEPGSDASPALRPVLRWFERGEATGLRFEVELALATSTESCRPPTVCEFDQVALAFQVDATSARLPEALAVAGSAGARYYWHVRHAGPGLECTWSPARWFEAGRVPNDFDGDSKSDVTVGEPGAALDSGRSGRFHVFRWDSSDAKTWSNPVVLSAPVPPMGGSEAFPGLGSLGGASVDANADGLADLITIDAHAALAANHVAAIFGPVLSADGQPLGQVELVTELNATSASVRVAAAGDANGDGTADVALATENGELYVLPRASDAPVTSPSLAPWSNASRLAVTGVGDLNGDGMAELAATCVGPASNPNLLVIPGSRGLDAVGVGSVPTGSEPSFGASAAPVDVDDDGFTDLMVTASTSRALVFRGGDVDVAAVAQGAPLVADLELDPAPVAPPRARPAGDLNGDGRADVVVATEAGVDAFAYVGTPPELVKLAVFHEPGSTVVEARGVGDVDGDGLDDVAVALQNAFPCDPSLGPTARTVRVYAGHRTSAALAPLGDPLAATELEGPECTFGDVLVSGL